jgi:hypothetical protein
MTGSPPGTVGQPKRRKKSYCMLELTLKRKSGTTRRVNGKWNISLCRLE